MVVVGDILIGSGGKHFFNQQIKFLLKLLEHDNQILFLGNIFQNKKSVNMYQYNMFVRTIKKFRDVVVILNKNDRWLDDVKDINAVSFLENINVKIISEPEIIKTIAFIPKQFDKDGQANAYKLLNFNDYSMIITNDLTSKFAISEKEAPIISNETTFLPNVTKVTSFNHKIGDDELFAYQINTKDKIVNDVHPTFIRMRLEDTKIFDYSKANGNHVILTTDKKFKDIYKRNKLINILKQKLIKLGAVEVNIDIKDADKVRNVKVKDIKTFVSKMNTIDNKVKKQIIDELSIKFKD